jgi:hypothetical protein
MWTTVPGAVFYNLIMSPEKVLINGIFKIKVKIECCSVVRDEGPDGPQRR